MRKYLFFLLIVVVAFNGLKNLRELNELAIVKAIGIDITKDGEYEITAIIMDTSEEENIEKGKIYNSTGKSVQEAIRYMVDKAQKKLYLAHMETLILSEEIARNNFMDTLDFFIRDNEGSNEFYLFIANKSSSKEIINVVNEKEINMSEMLKSSSVYRANSNTKTLNDNIKDILRPGRDILVNSCKIEDEQIKIDDMAYFSKWQMLGFLSDEESIICNILNNNSENTIVTVGENENLVVSEIINCSSNMSVKGENNIKIKVDILANISETGTNIIISDSKNILEVEKQIEEKMKMQIIDLVDNLKNTYKTDLIGIGNLLYRKNNMLYKEVDYLDKVNIEVEVIAKIQNQGGVVKKW